MTSSSNHTQFWLALLTYPHDIQQRTRAWNGYLAWRLPDDFRHEIRNVGNPPFNQFAQGQPLQLNEDERKLLDELAEEYGGHPTFSDASSTVPPPYMDFSNHIFQDEICFSDRILVNANFTCARFRSLADFRNATFVGAADFGKSIFEMRSRFDEARFENTVYFRSTTFKETTVFDGVEFKVAAYFERANFIPVSGIQGYPLGGVGFRNAIFTNEVSFREAQLEVSANLEGAKFKDTASFQSSRFSKSAEFRGSEFGRVADFSFAEFKQQSNFSDVSFKSTTYFRFTSFLEPPKFFEADLHEDTDFSGVDWHRSEGSYTVSLWSRFSCNRGNGHMDTNIVGASSAMQAWDRLALVMSKLEKLPERHNFYKLRMRAQRKRDGWGLVSLVNWLFDVLSDYGWSVRRALISWSLHFVGMGIFIFTQAWSSGKEWRGILCDSLLVSFANAHAFLGLATDGGYLYGARLRLAAEIHDPSILNAVGVLETVIGPILLFLLLLTLRNRFRLR